MDRMGTFQISRRAAFLALVTLAVPAIAQTTSKPTTPSTLRLGTGGAFSSIDPHYHNIGSNNVIADHIFDTLVRFDPKYRPVPGLALSWTASIRISRSSSCARA
jgi:peptide/nickel transport system substrate-binding protein